MLRNFPNDLRSTAGLQSLVGEPRGSALQWKGNWIPWATSSQGDCTGEFPKGFRGRFRTSLVGIRFNRVIYIMPKHVLKLKGIRKCLETFEMTHSRVSRSSSESEAPGIPCYSWGSQGPWIGDIPMDADGEFPEEFRGGFRTSFEGMSSKSIILVIPKICLKHTDFRKYPETFETTPLECPPRVASRRPPG